MSSQRAPHGKLNSLRVRLILSALLLILLLLPTIGFALNNAFKQQVMTNVREQLSAYLYSVLAVAEMDDGKLYMPEALLENQFNVIGSGLYAVIDSAGDHRTESVRLGENQNDSQSDNQTESDRQASVEPLWSSNSFLGLNLTTPLPHPKVGRSEFGELMLEQQPHLIYSFSVRFAPGETQRQSAPITIHIIKDLDGVAQQLKAFSQHLWSWLVVLMLVLLAIQFAWLAWTLKPLARFREELGQVQRGEAEQLSGHYPNELQAVAKQLNTLLSTEQRQRSRYRNALSDLAHSLKTPLAVIQSQKDLSPTSLEQVGQINRTIGHQLKRAQSAAGNAWHLGIKVSLVSDKLLRTLVKIHPGVALSYGKAPEENQIFYGDQSDLTEMLGNLLDNACKAARNKVMLSVDADNGKLIISVEDDGAGISPEQRQLILERGRRADTYEKGHGIGLAIVGDLVQSYQGHLTIDSSTTLGGAKFSLSFPQQFAE
ncbi:GHKL domain-containing protein [Shewanella alkalitolerans]|uniref:ATP-binding protein n=1 Tax=Shewanella alkalitolerans TaxID=2864209 RepID=UPI001C656B77|nr:ATP-binding protein [Shewanella alkalitolerans]QYJ96612.1 GHKL domain-containing protein [Shewanella alkalitolerans]